MDYGLVNRSAYTAAKGVAQAVAKGKGQILSAKDMDARWSNKDQVYLDSVGHALNLAVNELADVLHKFFTTVAQEADN
jgi:hypothetical protein